MFSQRITALRTMMPSVGRIVRDGMSTTTTTTMATQRFALHTTACPLCPLLPASTCTAFPTRSAMPNYSQSPAPHSLLTQIRTFAKGGKTNKSAAKRFKVMANGRIKRGSEGRSHNTGHKSKKRKNNLATTKGISGKKIEDRIRHMLGIRK